MEFMRPLAVGKERQNDNTAAAAQRVSQSVGHSVTQTASQPSPPEHCNHHQKQNPTIINHSSQSCIQVAGVRTDAVFPESVHEVIVSVELLAYIAPPDCTNGSTVRAAQTKRITITTKTIHPTSTRASSSKWQCQRKGGAPNHSHINLPNTDARKVNNRIDEATRAKPRSEEGGARCAMK